MSSPFLGEAKKGWYPLPFPLRGIAALDSRRQGSELDKRRGVPVAPLAREGDEGLSFAGGAFFALKGRQRATLRERRARLTVDRAPIPDLRMRRAQWAKLKGPCEPRVDDVIVGGDTVPGQSRATPPEDWHSGPHWPAGATALNVRPIVGGSHATFEWVEDRELFIDLRFWGGGLFLCSTSRAQPFRGSPISGHASDSITRCTRARVEIIENSAAEACARQI